jgi:glycosyltransferase involved in cell wall biosynthesis
MTSGARRVAVLVPGDLTSRTGGYGYDRQIIARLRTIGCTVDVVSLDASYPFPSASARSHAGAALRELADRSLVLADGLAFGAMAEEAEAQAERLKFVALVHHPLATETGLLPEQIEPLFESERRALACAKAIVVTSHQTVATLEPYGVLADSVTVIEPGTDPRTPARGSTGSSVQLICVASLSARKGHEVLVDALSTLKDLSWHLTCVGDTERAPETVARLGERIAASGLQDRISLIGECGEHEVAQHYDRSDVFVLPTRHEGYGMAVAEALAFGLPVIATPVGAIGHLVGANAGVLVPVGDVDALSQALRRVIVDRAYRSALAAGARSAGRRLPTWQDAAAAMSDLLSTVNS